MKYKILTVMLTVVIGIMALVIGVGSFHYNDMINFYEDAEILREDMYDDYKNVGLSITELEDDRAIIEGRILDRNVYIGELISDGNATTERIIELQNEMSYDRQLLRIINCDIATNWALLYEYEEYLDRLDDIIYFEF